MQFSCPIFSTNTKLQPANNQLTKYSTKFANQQIINKVKNGLLALSHQNPRNDCLLLLTFLTISILDQLQYSNKSLSRRCLAKKRRNQPTIISFPPYFVIKKVRKKKYGIRVNLSMPRLTPYYYYAMHRPLALGAVSLCNHARSVYGASKQIIII